VIGRASGLQKIYAAYPEGFFSRIGVARKPRGTGNPHSPGKQLLKWVVDRWSWWWWSMA